MSDNPAFRFQGLWMPAGVMLHPELSFLERHLLVMVDALYDVDQGGCWASNAYFVKLLGVTDRHVRRTVQALLDGGWIAQEEDARGGRLLHITGKAKALFVTPKPDKNVRVSDKNVRVSDKNVRASSLLYTKDSLGDRGERADAHPSAPDGAAPASPPTGEAEPATKKPVQAPAQVSDTAAAPRATAAPRRAPQRLGEYDHPAMVSFDAHFVRANRGHPSRDRRWELQTEKLHDQHGSTEFDRALAGYFSCQDGQDSWPEERGYELATFVRQFDKWRNGKARAKKAPAAAPKQPGGGSYAHQVEANRQRMRARQAAQPAAGGGGHADG